MTKNTSYLFDKILLKWVYIRFRYSETSFSFFVLAEVNRAYHKVMKVIQYIAIVATLATFLMLAAADPKAQFFDKPPPGQVKRS